MKHSNAKPLAQYDIRLLRIFKTVVECGGFAAAESVLGVGRSTISVHISSLETRMGFKLCLRGRGGFSLTDNGQQVYHGLIDLFDSMDDFALLVSNLGDQLSGELVILCTDMFGDTNQQTIANVIAALHEQAPNLRISFDTESVANIERKLLQDKAHIGLLPPYHRIDGLDYQAISSEEIYLCCSRQHPLFGLPEKQVTESILSQYPAIHPGLDIDPVGREQLQKLNLAANAYQFSTRKTLIMSGSYIGYMPKSYIQSELENQQIRLLGPNVNNYQFTLSLVTRKNPREVKKVHLAQSLFEQHFNQ